MLFPLGQLVVTREVNDRITIDENFAKFVINSLQRHKQGDWGELPQEDKKANQEALQQGFRLFSAYEGKNLPKIWIITESDRSITTILFPSEY